MSMVRKQLYIDEELNERLRMLAARTGLSEAEHVRAALRAYLASDQFDVEHGPNPLLDLVGLIDDPDGPDDVAHRHDDYLYGEDRRTVSRPA